MKQSIKNIKYKIYRPSSNPYISGDTFRNFSDHIYDDISTFNPTSVSTGDFIFVKTDFIYEFFSEVDTKINKKYFLITHNSDVNIKADMNFNLNNVIRWFAQNLENSTNQKISMLPIGLENKMYLKNGIPSRFSKSNILKNENKLILSCFRDYSNKNRLEINKTLENNKIIDKYSEITNRKYLSLVSEYKFNISPEGNGFDSHRLWESIILESIPIVENTSFISNLASEGVPLLVLNDWKEIYGITPKFLNDYYKKNLTKVKSYKKVYFEYWKNLFLLEREKFLS